MSAFDCVGITATRLGLSAAQKEQLVIRLHALGAKRMHHGMCVGGDEDAHAIGRSLGMWIVGHPPLAPGLRAKVECDEYRRPAGYLARDRRIVLESAYLIGCPDGPKRRRSGTWYTLGFAHERHLPYEVIDPQGNISRHPS